MIDRRHVLGAAGAFAATFAGAGASTARPAGNVTSLTGRATAVAGNGAERRLGLADPVALAELVQTAAESRLGLKLGATTLVNLGPSTRLKLDPFLVDAGGTFDLVEGSMLFEHVRPRGSPPGKAEIRSPYGLLAVRGTRFWAGINRGRFGVFVVEGKVDVSGGGRSVSLLAGWGTDVTRPGAAPASPRAWPVERQREIYRLTLGAVPRR